MAVNYRDCTKQLMNKTTKRNIVGSILCLLSCCILGGLALAFCMMCELNQSNDGGVERYDKLACGVIITEFGSGRRLGRTHHSRRGTNSPKQTNHKSATTVAPTLYHCDAQAPFHLCRKYMLVSEELGL